MKGQYIIFCFLLLFASCSSQKDTDNWKDYNLRGKVKSFTSRTYDAKYESDKIVKGKLQYILVPIDLTTPKHQFVSFNKKGSKIKESFSSERIEFPEITTIFDNNGNEIEITEYETGSNRITNKVVNEYNKKGLKIACSIFDSTNNLISENKREYCESGDIKELITIINGDVREKIYYIYYDNKDLSSTSVSTFVNSEQKTYNSKNYNKVGQLALETVFAFKAPYTKAYLITDSKFNYDDEGRLTMRTVSTKSQSEYLSPQNMVFKYQYDSFGYLIVESVTDETKNDIYRFGYNTFGDLTNVSYKSNFSQQYKYSYSYEYDKNSNWIVKVVYKDGKAISFIERELKYF